MKIKDILKSAIEDIQKENNYVPAIVIKLSLKEYPKEAISKDNFIPEEEITGGTATVRKGTGDKTGRHLVEKVITPRDVSKPHHRQFRSSIMHPEAAREIFGGQVAKQLGLDHYPEYTIKSSVRHKDPMKHRIVMHSTYVEGRPLLDFEDMQHVGESKEPVSFLLQKTLKKLNPESVAHAAIFNYIINHGDQHAGNFMVTKDNRLVPIDYGRSVHPLSQEVPLFSQDNHILGRHFLDLHSKQTINPELLKKIADKKQNILSLLDKIVLPHYPEHLRQEVREGMENRLQALASLAEHKAPTFYHLSSLLKSSPNQEIDFFSPTRQAPQPENKNNVDLEAATRVAG